MDYSHFLVTINEGIARVSINRPQKANALALPAWEEMKAVFDALSDRSDVRVVILSGEGKLFCAGIDLELLMSVKDLERNPSAGHRSDALLTLVEKLQACVTAIEQCRKPVLAAVHNGCIGGGVDIIAACDLRYCTDDAYFVIKEIDMGMVADLGTLQRLPAFVKPAVVTEMALTGRAVMAEEAAAIGLVNTRYATREIMLEEVQKIAAVIASKSPLSVRGTKQVLLHARDHSVREGLDFIARHNAAHLLSDDLTESFKAAMEKRKAKYKD
ncbi:MAG: crotonase/enoyl-CoA hydratase family protein [Cytophagales bacterium]|nr:crotonase/enoyl-CoA hydratase family protein [Cytophagales bacterium]